MEGPTTYSPNLPAMLRATINLPSSKSISNRALLLCALSGPDSSVERMSNCDDTYVMWRALTQRPATVDIMAAGTAMRFMTAYFAICRGEEHTITGTERMRQRPIKVLVDALRQLGADISYMDNEGYPPLHIKGRNLQGGRISLPASVSSQYISALLLVAPTMTQGLTLELVGDIISRPYINMTVSMMRTFGADIEWTDAHTLHVAPHAYLSDVIYPVESDWSAASYWYEMMALTPDAGATITLPWLYKESLQGDSAVSRYFEPLGVHTAYDTEHELVVLTKCADALLPEGQAYELDLIGQPDLAQTLVVTCAMLRRPFRFSGLRSLRIKETDRMAALQAELAKFGIALGIEADDVLYIDSYADGTPHYNGQPIATYHDHRMAMAFAPAAMVCEGVQIANPEVVSKSYPRYWEDLEGLG
ncbi:3-phosphoshikimate 1-carboxyvinyltransferase [Prevotellamassilia timonensis]|uniref:3-phosphoshikimate 1-carboxyvinyltransferase n=1 Tax=Prevotellamassilia timonensis TaxID=1852370 RepID=UPI00307ACA5A